MIKDFIPLFGNKLYLNSVKLSNKYDEFTIEDIKSNKIKSVVVFLANEVDIYKEIGLNVIFFSNGNVNIPVLDKKFMSFIKAIVFTLKRNNVLIYSNNEYGLSGLVAACVLVYLNIDSKKATSIIKGKWVDAIKNKEQFDFIADFYSNKKILESRYRKETK